MERLPDRTAGPRLAIRRYDVEDAEQLGAVVADNVEHLRPFMRWISFEPLARDQRRDLIVEWEEDWQSGGDVVMGAFLGGELVGSTGLHRRLGPEALEIGYWVSRHHLRRGFATEISRALTDLAFTAPGIDRVEIHHDLANTASAGVPRALGFEDLGERPEPRPEKAPAETGVDRAWGVTRRRWAKIAR